MIAPRRAHNRPRFLPPLVVKAKLAGNQFGTSEESKFRNCQPSRPTDRKDPLAPGTNFAVQCAVGSRDVSLSDTGHTAYNNTVQAVLNYDCDGISLSQVVLTLRQINSEVLQLSIEHKIPCNWCHCK